ncbi:MAG: hypothetical protein JSW34_03140 [Candidatus Zixiibacteriota bacterium]|nr:MAG: hypothetical protein JSW34_03140 [candidate division Zixibacteria bacterium]
MRYVMFLVPLCIFLILPAVAGEKKMDVGKMIIFDMSPEEQIARYGKLAGSDLTPEELLLMAADTFEGDTLRLLAILVEWDDREHTYPADTFYSRLFSTDDTTFGSLTEYFSEVSYGELTVTGELIDWFNYGADYESFTSYADLFDMLDPYVDYNDFDGDHNGKVDAILIISAGPGWEDSQDPEDPWCSTSGVGTPLGPFDQGVKIHQWSQCSELKPLRMPSDPTQFSGEYEPVGIRMFAHELCHQLKLPDLYDYDGKLNESTYYTPADSNDHPLVDWCVMGYYGYGYLSLGSTIPSHLCGWSKMKAHWIQPVSLDGEYSDLVIYDIEMHSENSLYKIPVGGSETEYFLLEYRNPNSAGIFDKLDSDFSSYFWPDVSYGNDPLDGGLLITHVDDAVADNELTGPNSGWPDYTHYTVAVEDAGYDPARDTLYNPEGGITDSAQWWYPYETRKGALFSDDVEGQNEFGPNTIPSSQGYYGYSGVYVRVDSIVGDSLYAYVNTYVQCCVVPGDADHSGELDPLDVNYLQSYLTRGGPPPPCPEEADANGDGEIDQQDANYLRDYLWKGGPAPVPCPE